MRTLDSTPAIVCLAHLGWDNVWQRPQHIFSRLARRYPILYINEPHVDGLPEGEPRLELVSDNGNVTAWQPVFPNRAAVLENWRALYLGLIERLLLDTGWTRLEGQKLVASRPLITWLYTPVPYYALDRIPSSLVVYDIMDELRNFKNAAADLKEREARVLQAADLVFAGGRSLYESRLGSHPNLHLFCSGVESEHFARALRADTEIAPEVADLPHPILGYYGVVDERLDLELLRSLAASYPEWSVAVIGPVAKIQPADLPQAPNLHYLGKQPYERLPNFLKAFDVCLMPFALNDATRYISPTKTLEYMAAHKPIVSTAVHDVVRNWGHVVYVAHDSSGFVAAVEQALAEDEQQRARRLAAERDILARNSWDQIARDMATLIETALLHKKEMRSPVPSVEPGSIR
jgi:glycosyltransferase involved in cell wall biosynthesis